jgi:SAM-dependent methyltransferase
MKQRQIFGAAPRRGADNELQFRASEEPDLIPTPVLMLQEADEVLEEWFAAGAEQSTLLRVLCGVDDMSHVLEVGCGLGRLAFALRRVLSNGAYLGLDVVSNKIAFLRERFAEPYPSFHFEHLDVRNGFYHPDGTTSGALASFPCADGWADAVVAMSVINHLLPVDIERYLSEIRRVLRPSGKALLSLFLFDNYRPEYQRPAHFSGAEFSFDHAVADTYGGVMTSDPTCPEAMLAIRWSCFRELAKRADLVPGSAPLPGIWSGTRRPWTMGQDLVVLKPATPR